MPFYTVDDVAAGFGAAPGPVPFLKTGGTMEGLGAWYHSLWYTAGVPGAGAAPAASLAGAAYTSDPSMVDGQVSFVKAAAGLEKRMGAFAATADRAGALLLLDRLWANGNINPATTGAQTVNSTSPGRDNDGSDAGEGVMVGLEVSAATGNGSPVTTITITYTNSAGVGSRTGTIASFPTTAAAGTLVPFRLQAGDRGVRSIQSITLGTTLVSGTVHLVQYRHLAKLAFAADGGVTVEKAWDQLSMVRLFDGSVPMLAWIPRDTTGVNIVAGELTYLEH